MLLLFDIDGTLLLKASDAHARAVREALRTVYGVERPPEHSVDAAGRTDLEIARRIALLSGIGAERFDAGRDTSAPPPPRPTRGSRPTTSPTASRPE